MVKRYFLIGATALTALVTLTAVAQDAVVELQPATACMMPFERPDDPVF